MSTGSAAWRAELEKWANVAGSRAPAADALVDEARRPSPPSILRAKSVEDDARQAARVTFASGATEASAEGSVGLLNAVGFVGSVVPDVAVWVSALAADVGIDTHRPLDRVEAAAALEALCLRQPISVRAAAAGHEEQMIGAASQLLQDALSGAAGAGHPDGSVSAAMASGALALLDCLVDCLEGNFGPDLAAFATSAAGQMLARARRGTNAGSPSLACTRVVRLLWRLSELPGSGRLVGNQRGGGDEALTSELVDALGRYAGVAGWGLAALVLAHLVASDESLPAAAGLASGSSSAVSDASSAEAEAVMIDCVLEAFGYALQGQEFHGVELRPAPLAWTVARMCSSDRFLKGLLGCEQQLDLIALLELGMRPVRNYGDGTRRACLSALVHLGVQPHCRAGVEEHPASDALRSRLVALATSTMMDDDGAPSSPTSSSSQEGTALAQLAVWALGAVGRWPWLSTDDPLAMQRQQQQGAFPSVMVAFGLAANESVAEQIAAGAGVLRSACARACGGLRVVGDDTFVAMCAESNAGKEPGSAGATAAAELVQVTAVVLAIHRGSKAVRKTASFFEFSLCLSRACLGKKMTFIYKWLKNAVFRRTRAHGRYSLPQLLLVFNFCSNNYVAAAVICLRTQSVDITKISLGLRELNQVH
jgi:hypothetical protein